MPRILLISAIGITCSQTFGHAADPGPLPFYAKDQCSNPIALVTAEMTLPVNGAKDIWHEGTQNDWIGKCVTAQWEDWNGRVNQINVLVGSTLPNPGVCSNISKEFNGGGGLGPPPKHPTWDFSGAGWCGLGSCTDILSKKNCTKDVRDLVPFTHGRLACLSHDICVWSRCQQDALRPNAQIAFADDDSGTLSFAEIRDLFSARRAETRLKRREPICGRAIYQTARAYFDVLNERIAKFEESNHRPKWWTRRRWTSKIVATRNNSASALDGALSDRSQSSSVHV